jgi:hypothetical protein
VKRGAARGVVGDAPLLCGDVFSPGARAAATQRAVAGDGGCGDAAGGSRKVTVLGRSALTATSAAAASLPGLLAAVASRLGRDGEAAGCGEAAPETTGGGRGGFVGCSPPLGTGAAAAEQ